jgi:FixJ family two-component response regulator
VEIVSLLIAIVDDEESVRLALKRLMISFGFRVNTFASGAEFIDSLRLNHPDCVVLDLHMPVMSGFDVQRKLRLSGETIPVVIVTGHDTPESESRAFREGAVAYLRKPVDDHEILDAVADAVGHRGTTRREPGQ